MDMQFVKGRRQNLVSVGWAHNVLQVEFKGGRRYQYAPVPQEVKDKLLRSPYPDHLFNQIVRGKYVSERVVDYTQRTIDLTTIPYDELPF